MSGDSSTAEQASRAGGRGELRAVRQTVLVVDDHELVRASLVMALRAKGMSAQACFALTISGIGEQAATFPAGLALLDLDLGLDDRGVPIEGADAVAVLLKLGWKVLVVSGSDRRRQAHIAAAIAAGACGYVPKTAPLSTLVEAVVQVAAGSPVMSATERKQWLELNRSCLADARRRTALLARLSIRERLVLERLADGRRAVEIAAEFVVSVSTIRSHIRAILAKLDVTSQLGAVALLREHEPG